MVPVATERLIGGPTQSQHSSSTAFSSNTPSNIGISKFYEYVKTFENLFTKCKSF